jgi:hypothetical protein
MSEPTTMSMMTPTRQPQIQPSINAPHKTPGSSRPAGDYEPNQRRRIRAITAPHPPPPPDSSDFWVYTRGSSRPDSHSGEYYLQSAAWRAL